MTIREKVARAVVAKQMENRDVYGFSLEEATAAITAFLEAAAEQGWRMLPNDATLAMQEVAMGHDVSHYPARAYRAMLAAAPKFESDG